MEAAPDYEPEEEANKEEEEEKEGDSVVSDEEFPPAKRAKKGFTIASSMDFTIASNNPSNKEACFLN